MAKKTKKHGSVLWLLGVSFLAVGLLLFCQFYFGDGLNDNSTYYPNTHINGIDVSGMTKQEAQNIISNKMLQESDKVLLTLKYDDKVWQLKGGDFEINTSIEEPLAEVMSYGREGNVFAKKKVANKIKEQGLNINISYTKLLGGIEDKLEKIINEIEEQGQTPLIEFNPNLEPMFNVTESKIAIKVNRDELSKEIDKAFENSSKAEVQIPITKVVPEYDKEDMLSKITLRSSFTTNYSTSSQDRKSNVKKALSSFNGMIVLPGEEISFNKTTGPRTVENGYKKANIILNGVYISGAGGGVCQASTTLYNALILADVEIVQSSHHSLPASYVPLSFDAMVSEGYADLVFKNTLESPIYIKAYGDDTEAHVEIYGQKFDDGISIRTRSEFVKIIPHNGDKIITDIKGEYVNHVLYKGEYHRLKYPREGYETKGFKQYIKDGKVIEEKLLRHDYYNSQDGIIVEGKEILGDGMSLPISNVKIIPAQKVTKANIEYVKNKLEQTYPSAYNP